MHSGGAASGSFPKDSIAKKAKKQEGKNVVLRRHYIYPYQNSKTTHIGT